MRSVNFRKIMAVSALGLVTFLGTSSVANAQRNRDDDRRRDDDQRNERVIRQQQQKIDKQRAQAESQRVRMEQLRRQTWERQNNRNGGRGTWDDYNRNNANNNRYRVYRNGSYYNTDNRGAELLRQAVNSGYQRGFQAGQRDRNDRRRSTWNNNSDYRAGSYGYENGVNRSQYQYYFQQGFQRGYQDGYNSRNQYGSNNGGSILGAILGQILNIQQY